MEIRFVDDLEGSRVVEELQVTVWGMSSLEVVPYHQLMVAAKWGGVTLVAYEDEVPIGFCYGFVGLDGIRPILCSHMLAVLPEHRSKNVGYRLKVTQREHARRRGLDRIIWTFDPLESRNAYLNLHKLGAFAEHYLADAYGPLDDELNRGLPSDRLLVDWRTDALTVDERPTTHLVGDEVPALNPPERSGSLPTPGLVSEAALGKPVIRIAVPGDATEIKRAGDGLAVSWRLNLRRAFEAAFAAGYRAVDLVPPVGGTAFYVLTRGED